MSNSPVKIGILGTGGVGGFFGGQLQKFCNQSPDAEVHFLSRQPGSDVIRENGLTLISDDVEEVIPVQHIHNPGDSVPHLDYLLVCTKSYGLEKAVADFKSGITEKTVIVPLLNGVEATEQLRVWFPHNKVAYGCVYLVSYRKAPGVIVQNGAVKSIYFGIPGEHDHDLKKLELVLQKAGINGHSSDIIHAIVWEKLIFISAVASLTTCLNKTMGEIRENIEWYSRLLRLADEAVSVAIGAGIPVPKDITEKTTKKIKEMPPDATSSMHRDFYNDKPSEYKVLTEFMVKAGRQYDVETPEFSKVVDWFHSVGLATSK